MHTLMFALACVACTGHGNRIHHSIDDLQESQSIKRLSLRTRRRPNTDDNACCSGTNQSSSIRCKTCRLSPLTNFLLALSLSPAAAFNPCSSHLRFLASPAIRNQRSCFGNSCPPTLRNEEQEVLMKSLKPTDSKKLGDETKRLKHPQASLKLREPKTTSIPTVTRVPRLKTEDRERLEATYKLDTAKKKQIQEEQEHAPELKNEEEEEVEELPVFALPLSKRQKGAEDKQWKEVFRNANGGTVHIVLTPAECSEKLDEMLADYTRYNSGSRKFSDEEVQALTFAVKKEHRWTEQREVINEERAKKKAKRLSDGSFAKALGLKGGAREYHRELNRLRMGKQLLLEGMIALIRWTAKRYRHKMSLQDLESICQRSLLKAALNYNAALGFKLSTLAVLCMRHSMIAAIATSTTTIKFPTTLQYHFRKILALKEKLQSDGFSEEEINTRIMQNLQISEERMEKIQKMAGTFRQKSSEEPIQKDGDAGGKTRQDYLYDEDTADLQDAVHGDLVNYDVVRILGMILKPRELQVLKHRYGLAEDERVMNLTELAKEMGLSVERVRQIETVALLKLRMM